MKCPKPFYRKQRDCWVLQVGKRTWTLASGKENEGEAWKAYHRVMASLGRGTAGEDGEKDAHIDMVCDLYLEYAQKRVVASTYEQYRMKLVDWVGWCDGAGLKRVGQLKPIHMTLWLESHAWSSSTARGAVTAVKIAFEWAEAREMIAENPFRKFKRPKMGRRTRTLQPAERLRVRGQCDPLFGEFLDALGWTGARPGEIARLEGRHIDFEAGWASLPGKTTKATGELIRFPLIPPMLELCRRLVGRWPDGPLFRNKRGTAWTAVVIGGRMRKIREELGLVGVTAYTYRHSFATDGLEKGIPIADMAALMNHRDIRTTMGYNHLMDRKEHLMRQAKKLASGPASRSPSA
jgi:integrase